MKIEPLSRYFASSVVDRLFAAFRKTRWIRRLRRRSVNCAPFRLE
jgi:hypothetical protein